jgi:ABC-type Na+ efflux pump permease subunit
MQISMRYRLIDKAGASAAIAVAIVVLGFATQAVSSQATVSTPVAATQSTADAAVTTAQLQAEIRELRAQVAQLQAAQNTSEEKTTTSGSHKSKDTMSGQHKKMGMFDGAGAKSPPPAKPMQPTGMGMDKHDAMSMPAPSADAPKDPPMKDD